MKKQNHSPLAEASSKFHLEAARLQLDLPMLDVILQTKAEVEALSAQAGLKIIHHFLEQEIEQCCGPHGQQSAYRHGHQPGYVIFAGRKVSIHKPRLRAKGGEELALQSYQAFQRDGRMQRAVARKLTHQVSTRNYAAAIDDCLEGYGIDKSSVSRQWKAATAAELQKLVQRPVPADLVALLIDGQYFRKQCLIVALGVDQQGQKHVLGLWQGATENSTLVRELLVDLRERGLNTEAAILVVVDGAKALYKGVRDVFGERALIQRCRVHKLRNVLEHLPLEKRAQAAWRLRGAWAKSTPEEALKELRACVMWLDTISPSAARSLEEGLEETLTITRLGLHESLVRTFSSTNLIESCFARTESWTRRVKRWRDARMVLRWGAAALLFAEKGFRRVRGCDHISQLIQALQNHHCELASIKRAA
ncbi:MAG: IS256 family transposase [Acidobacteriales bacterium]|nr:IS256 family transposase [Terriglobales bacterium]